MSRISRAGDSLWAVSAFDPRKPVDDDWWRKPAPKLLRNGLEPAIFGDSPYEHHQGTDAMQWNPDSAGAEDPDYDEDEDRSGAVLPGGELAPSSRPDPPQHDLAAIGRHANRLRGVGGSTPIGELVGSDPRGPLAQYYNNSNVAHYYTYNPHDRDNGRPWVVSTTHWQLNEPVTSRHETFEQATLGAKQHKSRLKYDLGID